MLSRTAIHALAAVAALSRLAPGTYVGTRQLAAQISAPPNYLGKLLKTLADHRLLESQKGKGGGFRLARDPHSIPLAEVIDPIEPLRRWSGCFVRPRPCSDQTPCPVHNRWRHVRDEYLRFLRETTVAELGRAALEDAEVGAGG